MAVAIIADVPGQTKEGYEQTIRILEGALRGAPGFIMHFGHPIDGGWRVVEVWESSKDAAEWFAKHVRPNLPSDIMPQRRAYELHTLISRWPAGSELERQAHQQQF
ncbi:MAG: hypothetical protein KatS3mg022_2742 [Armatimonadota bacterium]|nr:MAG: hypothetical protein KatS3mg022_2742 [Armatimonadota bacterium]